MSEDDANGNSTEKKMTTRRSALATFGTVAGSLVAASGTASAVNNDIDIWVDPEEPVIGEETTFKGTIGVGKFSWFIAGPGGFEQYSERTVSTTFEEAGEYTAYLTVELPDGESSYVTKSGQIVESRDVEPTADFEISPQDPVYNPVTFDASGSSTPAGEIESYDWYVRNTSRNSDPLFDNSPIASGETFEESFSLGDRWKVGVEVTNTSGNTDRKEKSFAPEEDPNTPSAKILVNGKEGKLLPSNPVTLDGSKSTTPNGSIESYTWEIYNYETDETRYESGETIELSLESEVRYKPTLTVIDENGKEDTELGSSIWPDADSVPQ